MTLLDAALLLQQKSKYQLSPEACGAIIIAYPDIDVDSLSYQDIVDRFIEIPRFTMLMHQECNQFVRLSNSILVLL